MCTTPGEHTSPSPSLTMSCFGNCIPKPDAYAKDIVAKMKKTASEGGDIL